ncbi:MAG TPA: NAD(P)-binding domain-containing protein [Thermoanaerobaculia bacterium]
MRIGIVGCGRMGRALGRRAAASGHEVLFGSRSPAAASEAARVAGPAAAGGTYAEAFAHGDLAILGLRWPHALRALSGAALPEGRILLDATNPSTPDGLSLVLGPDTSGAEQIARAEPRARVVKAFNHVYAEVVEAPTGFAGGRPAVFYCGDDAAAVDAAGRFIESLGFDAVFSGPLSVARYLEPLAQLAVALVEGRGNAPASLAIGLLRPEDRRRASAPIRETA